MAKQTINIGASPNDGTGTPLRTSFDYCNQNFTELYTSLGGGTGLPGLNGEVIFNNGTSLAGDPAFVFDAATDMLSVTGFKTFLTTQLSTIGTLYVGTLATPKLKVDVTGTGITTITQADITGDLAVRTTGLTVNSSGVGIGLTAALGAGNIQIGAGKYLGYSASAYITPEDNVQGARFKADNILIDGNTSTKWNIGGTSAMTLNSTGLGVGTSNFAYKLNAAGFIAAVDPSFTGTGGSLIGAMLNNDNTAPGLDIRRWTGTAATHGTTYICTDSSGATFFYNGQQASNTKATSLKMTLDASGNLLVGLSSGALVSSGSRFRITTDSGPTIDARSTVSGNSVVAEWNSATTGDNVFNSFWTETSGIQRGSISYNRTGGLVAYNTTSDYRAKDIIGPVSNSGSVIDSLKVYTGKMKGAMIERPMLVAHEAQTAAPYSVTGQKDEVDSDGNPKYQQMDVSSFVPLLIAEIQSLRTRVAALEA